MTENKNTSKAVIVREPQNIVVASISALTIWKGAKRALPVVGTAAIVWAGRKAASTLLRWSQSKNIAMPELPQSRLPLKHQNQRETTPKVHVSYTYSAVRWTLHIGPSATDAPDDSALD